MANVPVAPARVEVGLFASRDVASLVSGLRLMSTAFPISIESLTGFKYASMRSKVDVALVFLFVLLDVLTLLFIRSKTDIILGELDGVRGCPVFDWSGSVG